MDPQASKQQLVERVKEATNILVTVSKNPSVDQLASALGLTLMLSKMDKHASAVVSGAIPPAIKFLEPDKTFDNSLDSLRDFVISLSTDKADKLRYKKEDGVVKIFITPYKTKLTKDDFEFTQGDLNVDVVIALGVQSRDDLDEAIKAHGRILHDATVISISNAVGADIGSINWIVPEASSISEMLVSVSEAFQGGILDEPMSTAFLTGIIAATDRFRNDKTSPKVMTMSAQLMAAGANQQLVATNLEQGGGLSHKVPPQPPSETVTLPEMVASDTQTANEIDAALNSATKSAEKTQVNTDDTLAKLEAEFSEKPAEQAENPAPAAPTAAPVEELADLQKQLESIAEPAADSQPAVELPTSEPAELDIDLPSLDILNVGEDSSGSLPIEEASTVLNADANKDSTKSSPAPSIDNQSAAIPVDNQRPSPDSMIQSDGRGRGPTSDQDINRTLGGTFNATTQQAEEEKKREADRDINKAILSHNAPPTDQSNMTNEQVRFGQEGSPQISTNPRPMEPMELNIDEARRAVEEASGGASVAANNSSQPLNAGSSFNTPPPLQPPGPSPQQVQNPAPPQQMLNQPGPSQLPGQMSQMQGPASQFPMPGQLPQQQMAPPLPAPGQLPGRPAPLTPPPPPPGGNAPSIAPRVSPSSLGSFAPNPQGPPMPQQPMQGPPQQPKFGPPPQQYGPPQPGQQGPPPPAPIQFDTTPPPGNLPNGQRPY